MLEGLDTIDWHSLGAPDVPAWLRSLASHDTEARADAFRRLDHAVVCSNVLDGYGRLAEVLSSDVPRLITPFLVEFARMEEVQWKEYIIELLQTLFLYYDVPGIDERTKVRALQVRIEVCRGWEVYVSLAASPNARVNESASWLASHCTEAS